MNKRIIITAGIFGILAVISGAFGAHGLKAYLSSSDMAVWHTAVEYQLFHTLALLFLSTQRNSWAARAAYYAFTVGIILFSGSLYLLAAKDILQLNWIWVLGPITPLGGLLFITGWICILVWGLKQSHVGV
jgi:uncharacterized membrane protein YgdD (TMEM256/DUF423 family)